MFFVVFLHKNDGKILSVCIIDLFALKTYNLINKIFM